MVGFGGSLSRGLYTVIIFSRAPSPEAATERFRNLAQDLQNAFGDFGPDRVFAPVPVGVA